MGRGGDEKRRTHRKYSRRHAASVVLMIYCEAWTGINAVHAWREKERGCMLDAKEMEDAFGEKICWRKTTERKHGLPKEKKAAKNETAMRRAWTRVAAVKWQWAGKVLSKQGRGKTRRIQTNFWSLTIVLLMHRRFDRILWEHDQSGQQMRVQKLLDTQRENTERRQ